MFEIQFKINDVEQKFTKNQITILDNMLALKHQVRISEYYSDEKKVFDAQKYGDLSENFLKMIVEMYGNKFTVDDLKGAPVSVQPKLEELFVAALGGVKNDDEKEEDKADDEKK